MNFKAQETHQNKDPQVQSQPKPQTRTQMWTEKARSGGNFENCYLLSRSLRPSQLLGGDLWRTEFMVHLFGTI